MKNVTVVQPSTSVREVIKLIDAAGRKVAFITDESGILLGLFTDGDMRRYILRNGDLSEPVEFAMNRKPVVFSVEDNMEDIMHNEKMVVYPIVDEDGKLVGAHYWNDVEKHHHVDNVLKDIPVVIMAGGKGTRLHPYTKILPKPLIPIGEYTISEHIINSFVKYGCHNFHFILNYKRNMIKAYFTDTEKAYEVNFLDENEFLGTGGGLSLLKGHIKGTFFVSNCDIVIDASFSSIYKYHKEQGNKITFICAMKNLTIPYGVVSLDEKGAINEIIEKPSYSFLTNTGLYVLEAEVIDELKENEFIHLPDIAKRLIDRGERVGVYPISEKSWMDMGEFKEMETMLNALGIE